MVRPYEASDTYADLNGGSPIKRYCAPLSRAPAHIGGAAPDEFGGFGAEIAYRFPFGIETTFDSAVLTRCGTKHEERLPVGDEITGPTTISAGIASWAGFVTRVRPAGTPWHGPLYRLKTVQPHRGGHFPVVTFEPGASRIVAHTATTVYESRPLPGAFQPPHFGEPTRYEIFAARVRN